MKPAHLLYALLPVSFFLACNSTHTNDMKETEAIQQELAQINGLLRDTAFATAMAGGQEAVYYEKQGQQAPDFFAGPDSSIKKSYKEDKIATNLAGFYAVECGIGALVAQKGETPVYWLQQIVQQKIDSTGMLLLNRFANATWKAGQPFRALQRITRDNFLVADFLSAEELEKDAAQVRAAATLLLDSLKEVIHAPATAQLEAINHLLKDKTFALKMAQHMEAAYYAGQQKEAPPFLSAAEDTATINKSAHEEKIAINIAGFYALECGVSYLSAVQHKLPSVILASIVSDSINAKDKQLLERFANATWKAGQPFRSLDRIARDVFKPFDMLSPDEVDKDWAQIQAAAKKLQETIK